MTREEREIAITNLEGIKRNYIEGYGYEEHPLPEYYAIEAGIEALKQEPCEDCISREEALKGVDMLCLETSYDNEKVADMIRDLPPVQPKQESCEDCVSIKAAKRLAEQLTALWCNNE